VYYTSRHKNVWGSGDRSSSHLPIYEDGTECCETSAYKIQKPGNYPKESIQHSGQDEGLKSRIDLRAFLTLVLGGGGDQLL